MFTYVPYLIVIADVAILALVGYRSSHITSRKQAVRYLFNTWGV